MGLHLITYSERYTLVGVGMGCPKSRSNALDKLLWPVPVFRSCVILKRVYLVVGEVEIPEKLLGHSISIYRLLPKQFVGFGYTTRMLFLAQEKPRRGLSGFKA